jgi:hypothetical protein
MLHSHYQNDDGILRSLCLVNGGGVGKYDLVQLAESYTTSRLSNVMVSVRSSGSSRVTVPMSPLPANERPAVMDRHGMLASRCSDRHVV